MLTTWVSYPVVLTAASNRKYCMAKKSPNHSGDLVLVSIGNTIRNLRLEAGLSQETLANEAGVDRSYMGGIERGEHNLTVMSLQKICSCLSISLNALFAKAGY